MKPTNLVSKDDARRSVKQRFWPFWSSVSSGRERCQRARHDTGLGHRVLR